MLPIPSAKYIPQAFENAVPFTDMLDRQFEDWFQDTWGIEHLKDISRSPPQFLDIMGEQFGADITEYDNERSKRVKILISQDMNRRRGMWLTVKPIIDAFCGGDSKFSYNISKDVLDDFYIRGQDSLITNDTIMAGQMDSANGIRIIAIDINIEPVLLKGMFLIDVDNKTLTTDQVVQLKEIIAGQMCAYFFIDLGYQDQAGIFVPYPNGGINR
jgi:hypothetical protein